MTLEAISEQLKKIEESLININNKSWVNISEASRYTSLSVTTIRRAVKKGDLKCSNKLGKLLFKVEWIDNWLGVK